MIDQKGHLVSRSSLVDAGFKGMAGEATTTTKSDVGVGKKRASAFTSVKSTANDPQIKQNKNIVADFVIQPDANTNIAPSDASEKSSTNQKITLTPQGAALNHIEPSGSIQRLGGEIGGSILR